MKNSQWALAWLAELDRIEKSHEEESEWITTNEAVKMLLEAQNILSTEVK